MKKPVIRNQNPSLQNLLIYIVATLCVFCLSCALQAGIWQENTIITVNTDRMRRDVEFLTSITPPRNINNISSLNQSAEYILEEFKKTGCRTDIQSFTHNGKVYKNVICSMGPKEGERIIIGAHYDVLGNQPGADDNASGIAGLLELTRLINATGPALYNPVDFVAYTLEERSVFREPFRTRHLGSYNHAKSLSEKGVKVKAMICLEMIGYFTDKPNSQRYPLFFLKWYYPDRGNFIAVVGKWGQHDLVDFVKKSMSEASTVSVESINAPPYMPGIDFSDHRSYWRFKYNAVMITDTAFYRNRNYHKPSDTVDTLDFNKMSEVVKGIYRTILNLSKTPS